MFVRDVSVPQAVKEIIMSNDLYLKAIKSGIANYTAIANKIQKEVEDTTNAKVNLGTIVVAIKRFADYTLKSQSDSANAYNDDSKQKPSEVYRDSMDKSHSLQEAKMKLTGSIIDIDFGDQSFFKNINELLDKLTGERLFVYNLIRTEERVRIITEDMLNSRGVISTLSEKCHGKVTQGLSKITINLFYDNNNDVRQLLFNIFDILGNYKISINNVFFTSNEIILVLDSDKATRAYDLIQKQIIKQ